MFDLTVPNSAGVLPVELTQLPNGDDQMPTIGQLPICNTPPPPNK